MSGFKTHCTIGTVIDKDLLALDVGFLVLGVRYSLLRVPRT